MARAEAKRVEPETREFCVAELLEATVRMGYYPRIFERLKLLAEEDKGLVIQFSSISAGSAATKRMAQFAEEDGYLLFQQKAPGAGADRYVYVQKKKVTA